MSTGRPETTAREGDLGARVVELFARAHGRGLLTERRGGQVRMAVAVAEAIERGSHLVVRAGTGVGKTWGYLVPALLSGERVVVATTTRSLQEQLAVRDLPRVQEALQRPVAWAVLKGRGNYLCRERLAEAQAGTTSGAGVADVGRLVAWGSATTTGDRDELPWEPSERAWRAVSVRSDECPGRDRCPSGERCFAELARDAAATADLVITNHHVYAAGLFASGKILPEHAVAVFDEAHRVDEAFRQTLTASVDPLALLAAVRRAEADAEPTDAVLAALERLRAALAPLVGAALEASPPSLAAALSDVHEALGAYAAIARRRAREDGEHRWLRSANVCALALENVTLTRGDHACVRWVEGSAERPVLRSVPPAVAAGEALERSSGRTVVLTSAAVGVEVARELGLADSVASLDVPSPFPYEQNALLYCAAHLPDPRSAAWAPAVHDELVELIAAAGGRTLALFTSWQALRLAAEHVAPRIDAEVVAQGTHSKRELLARLARGGEPACVFATAGGMAEGVDVPGDVLTLVAIDRLPFPPRHDPSMAARRLAKGEDAFRAVDLRHAGTQLAQAAGRLIRTHHDRGVFAVLDPRLASAGYRAELLRRLPPMSRTTVRADACAFLRRAASKRSASRPDVG